MEREGELVCVLYTSGGGGVCVCICVYYAGIVELVWISYFMVLFHFFELIPCLDFKLFISWGGLWSKVAN